MRYADDFVILCKTRQEAENALIFVQEVLAALKLECSPEKTKIASLHEGFQFLGFDIRYDRITIRQKSREKLEESLKALTRRSHNLDAKVFQKLSSIIRGTINYFCTSFSNVLTYFEDVGKWIRMRLRCMKYNAISKSNNFKCKNKILARMGMPDIRFLCLQAKKQSKHSLRGKQMGAAH